MLRAAKARMQAGEPPPPLILYDVTALTAEARQPGLRGQLARARLRLIEGVSPEGLLPPRVEPQDGRGEDDLTPTIEHRPS